MSEWIYDFGRTFLNQTIQLYYRRIEVVGRERIPATGAAILVANHPNSSTDAFLLTSQLTDRKINLIAKDFIAQSPLYGWLVRRFGVVGVARAIDYERQRDLARERNLTAVGTCVPRLLAGELVAIFGEGISTDARRLQMIRKGAMRFGLAAERAAEFRLGLRWIPVGISYSAKQRFRTDVLIRIGEPFRLSDLHPDPAAHEPAVLQIGTRRLQTDIESLILNIEHDELATLIDSLAELLASAPASLDARVARQQRVARAVTYFNVAQPDRVRKLRHALTRYQSRLQAADLADDVIRLRHPTSEFWRSLLAVVRNSALMLLNLYGWANSFLPRWGSAVLRPLWRYADARSGPKNPAVIGATSREALWGTYAGWVTAVVAFPLQTYLVYWWVASLRGPLVGAVAAVFYGLSLVPSWRLFVHRRDIFRHHYEQLLNAVRFMLNTGPAIRLRRLRRRVVRPLKSLLAAYDAAAPPAGRR
jgi:1-acyl-sn-glycerol-3-phosphate acyltransferase